MSTTAPPRPSGFGSPALRTEIARLRDVDNLTNLGPLAFESLCQAAVVAGGVAFGENRASWRIARGGTSPYSPSPSS